MSILLVTYFIYEIRKNYLSDLCNLKSKDSAVILENKYLLYLHKRRNTNYCVYLFYEDISYCLYNRKYNRLDIYGKIYKAVRQDDNKFGRVIELDYFALYDMYSQQIVQILQSAGVNIKEAKIKSRSSIEI